ncbi:MAG: nucleotidyltransferase domain-containing protein [Candidatus Azobacteroides sp.]|nr:nucleotidyltransferase domain-containing protein [Candidatus Azobacteroides sp.]
MKRPEIIEKLRNKIAELPTKVTIILFGSEARGDARPDSDIDLLILVEGNNLNEEEVQKIIYPLFRIEDETHILINPVVKLKKEWGKIKTPFYENVTKDGIILC